MNLTELEVVRELLMAQEDHLRDPLNLAAYGRMVALTYQLEDEACPGHQWEPYQEFFTCKRCKSLRRSESRSLGGGAMPYRIILPDAGPHDN